MWQQFDPKGAMVGAGLLIVILLVAASFMLPAPKRTVTLKIDLPPAAKR